MNWLDCLVCCSADAMFWKRKEGMRRMIICMRSAKRGGSNVLEERGFDARLPIASN